MADTENSHENDIADVGFIAVMSREEAERSFNEMYNLWRITSTGDKKVMKNTLLVWFALNGASSRADYNGVPPITIHGNAYSLSVVPQVVGSDVRKFARAYADEIKRLLKVFKDKANMLADKHGVQYGLGHVCFDVADYCTNNTEAEKEVIAEMKSISISTASKYRLVKHKAERLRTNAPPPGGPPRDRKSVV